MTPRCVSALGSHLDPGEARQAAQDTVNFRRSIAGRSDLSFGETTGPAKFTDTPDGELLGVYTPRRNTAVTADDDGGIAGWVDPHSGGHLTE